MGSKEKLINNDVSNSSNLDKKNNYFTIGETTINIQPRERENNSTNLKTNEVNIHSYHSRDEEQGNNIQTETKFKTKQQNSRNTSFGLKEISKRVMEIIKLNGQTTYRSISDQIGKDYMI